VVHRFLPEEPFPPYSFVPGLNPHPEAEPAAQAVQAALSMPEPEHWQECRPYLRGLDLFNHGYYWEAHEVWEGLWHACGREGPRADFLKGLIKLAAAGVKVREGQPEGVRGHAARAAELFREVAGVQGPHYFGLSLQELAGWADEIAGNPPPPCSDPSPLVPPQEGREEGATAPPQGQIPAVPVEVVFRFVLWPQ
jgi:hypothetical protein